MTESTPTFVEKADPEEVFAALSNATRVAILRTLWDAEDHEATFSDLRAEVGMRDSGQFNYHLGTLVGSFVAKTDEGYELTQAGMQINGAIEAGSYTAETAIEPIALADPCATCGGTRTLHYEDETVRVECESCPVTVEFGVPPSVFAACDRTAIPDVASRYLRATFRHIDDGFCPFCDGPVRPTVGPLPEISDRVDSIDGDVPDDVFERVENVPLIRYDCRRCGAAPTGGLGLALLDHPAVAGFYWDHGIDVRDRSVWEFTAATTDRERVRSRSPFRAHAIYRVGNDSITLLVDEHLEVVDVERSE